MNTNYIHKYEPGAVSLFVVIFTSLIMTVLTISFIQIMLRDQQQATATDLSQSAYDSAQAGVEDAKRALLLYQNACTSGATATCNTLRNIFNSDECDTLTQIPALGVGSDPQETLVQQSSGDAKLDQAYTCVKVILDTDDYLGSLQTDESKVIMLRGTATFDRIDIDWFSEKDLSTPTASVDLSIGTSSFPARSAWPINRPPVMRAHLIQPANSFRVSDFDTASGGSDARTLFLYPSQTGAVGGVSFATDLRRSSTNDPPSRIACASIVAGGYACQTTMVLPGSIPANQAIYLELATVYNKANFRLALRNGATSVSLDGVQPAVDSTGRANALFRRIQARIELSDETFPYPQSALDLSGDLCKNFIVTDNPSDYASVCTP